MRKFNFWLVIILVALLSYITFCRPASAGEFYISVTVQSPYMYYPPVYPVYYQPYPVRVYPAPYYVPHSVIYANPYQSKYGYQYDVRPYGYYQRGTHSSYRKHQSRHQNSHKKH